MKHKLFLLVLAVLVLIGINALGATAQVGYTLEQAAPYPSGGAASSNSYMGQFAIGELAAGESSSASYSLISGVTQLPLYKVYLPLVLCSQG
jgi:hypothetical protein